jgi:hypothetical protein
MIHAREAARRRCEFGVPGPAAEYMTLAAGEEEIRGSPSARGCCPGCTVVRRGIVAVVITIFCPLPRIAGHVVKAFGSKCQAGEV